VISGKPQKLFRKETQNERRFCTHQPARTVLPFGLDVVVRVVVVTETVVVYGAFRGDTTTYQRECEKQSRSNSIESISDGGGYSQSRGDDSDDETNEKASSNDSKLSSRSRGKDGGGYSRVCGDNWGRGDRAHHSRSLVHEESRFGTTLRGARFGRERDGSGVEAKIERRGLIVVVVATFCGGGCGGGERNFDRRGCCCRGRRGNR